eukprot:4452775-Pleurochrysis_carterae.AAC.5
MSACLVTAWPVRAQDSPLVERSVFDAYEKGTRGYIENPAWGKKGIEIAQDDTDRLKGGRIRSRASKYVYPQVLSWKHPKAFVTNSVLVVPAASCASHIMALIASANMLSAPFFIAIRYRACTHVLQE